MTPKQLYRRLNKNAQNFALKGDLSKSYACMEVAAMLHREGYINYRGHFEINEVDI